MKAPAAQGPAAKIGRRGTSRLRLHVPAQLLLTDGNCRCLLDDISRTGARISVLRHVPLGGDAILRCGALECFGRIVWADRDMCGLEFDEPLSPQTLVTLRAMRDHIAEAELQQRRSMAREWIVGER